MPDIAIILWTGNAYHVKYGKDEKYITSNSLDMVLELLGEKNIPYTLQKEV